jgi:hypothetical protein
MKINWRKLVPTMYMFDIVKFGNGTYGVRRRIIRFAKKDILLVGFLDSGEQNYWWSSCSPDSYYQYKDLQRARDDLALCERHGDHPNITAKKRKEQILREYRPMTKEDLVQEIIQKGKY